MINPQAELINCLGCGRETRAKQGICGRCCAARRTGHTGEYAGRKTRSLRTIGGSPIHDIDDDDDSLEFSDRQYHGDSPRDDL